MKNIISWFYAFIFAMQFNSAVKKGIYFDTEPEEDDFADIRGEYGVDDMEGMTKNRAGEEDEIHGVDEEEAAKIVAENEAKEKELNKNKEPKKEEKKEEPKETKKEEPAEEEKETKKEEPKEEKKEGEEDEATTIRIGKKDYPLDEITEKAQKHFSEVDFTKISIERKAEYIRSYIQDAHFEEARGAIDTRHNEIAEQRKQVEKKEVTLNTQLEQIAEKRKDLEKILGTDTTALKKKLDNAVDEKEIEELEDQIDTIKVQRVLAQDGLKKLKEAEENRVEELNNTSLELFVLDMQTIPELATEKHMYDIIEEFNTRGANAVDINEYQKAKLQQRIINDYLKEKPKTDLITYIQYNSASYFSNGKITVPDKKGKTTDKDEKKERLNEVVTSKAIEKLLEKQKKNPNIPEGKSKSKSSTEGLKEKDNEPELSLEDMNYR